MWLLKDRPENICPPTLGTYTFNIPLLGFKLSAHFIIIHNLIAVCHTAMKSFAFYKSRRFITTYTTAYQWTSTPPEVSKPHTTPSILILSSHLSLPPLMFSFFQFFNQNLLIFLNCTGWWTEPSIRWSIGLSVFIQDILLCSTVRV
jgi:hypothetical protein